MTCEIVTLDTLRRRRFLCDLRAMTAKVQASADYLTRRRMRDRLRLLNSTDVEIRR